MQISEGYGFGAADRCRPWGYLAVLINLGVVMLIVVLLGAALRLLETRLPGGSPAAPEAAAVVVPGPGSGAESVPHRDT
ncbi:hypothetical protein [Actinoplanes philippinensis]|uniref:hypothetical protein n=1 Tax=Actinoplanes philippinensis TaxID=35752 RepID=UPI0033F59725